MTQKLLAGNMVISRPLIYNDLSGLLLIAATELSRGFPFCIDVYRRECPYGEELVPDV